MTAPVDLLRFVSMLSPPKEVVGSPLLPFVPIVQLYFLWRLGEEVYRKLQARRALGGSLWHDLCVDQPRELLTRAKAARDRGDLDEARRLLDRANLLLDACETPVQGFALFPSWYTVWNGRGWLNARKLYPADAEDWHVAQLDAMGGRQPLANISLWRWSGKTWTRVA